MSEQSEAKLNEEASDNQGSEAAPVADVDAAAGPEAVAADEAPAPDTAPEAAAEEPSAPEAASESASEAPAEEASEAVVAEAEAPAEAAPTEAAPAEATAPEPAAPEAASESASEAPAEEASEAVVAEAEVPAEAAPTEATASEAPAAEAASEVVSEVPAKAVVAEAEASAEAAPAEATASEAPAAEASAKEAPPEAEKVEEVSPERLQRQQETMAVLTKALEEKSTVSGKVIGWNKGGYHVAVGEIAAFCPVSQIEIGNPRSPKRYMDRDLDFRVIEIEPGGRRVVLSRAEELKAKRKAQAKEIRENLVAGATLEGKVRSVTDFGAFVNLGGGVEGLVHVSEISRRRVEHPKDALSVGQKVKVSVLKVENNGARISLSMKRLEADPWKGTGERFAAGTPFKGKVVRKAEFGLFVEVEPGLEGLIHTSRFPLGTGLDNFEPGIEVEGWVHDCQPKRRRLSLSLREVAQGDPWSGVGERYPVGTVIKGRVERLARFGAFIEVEPGLTGLLPFSEISLSPGANPRRWFHPGREVSVQVMSVDAGRRRLSLGTETSKAEGSVSDFRDYQEQQSDTGGTGLGTMAAAFAKLKK